MSRLLSLVLPIFSALCLVPPLPCQSRNVRVLARFNPPGSFLNDVWGYVTPAGKEYTLVGSLTGTYVLDTSDPRKPIQRGFIPNSASGWRNVRWSDIKTYRHYAYVVNEGGAGMQIIDLKDPDRPKLLKTWGTSLWRRAHNLGLDVEQGVAYVCGTNAGMPILDLKTNPENPRHIGTYRANYVHDIMLQDGFAHAAEMFARVYRILDVTKLPATPSLGTGTVPAAHNVWPTRDNAFAVTTSETAGGHLRIFDIRNKRALRQIAAYQVGSSRASAHNAYVRDRVVYMSYYSEGFRVVDISNPARPVEVGFYDTSSATGGFTGAWGCYAFHPSGAIYISDRPTGLFIFKPKASTTHYGKGTNGTGGKLPEIHSFGSAYLGNGFFRFEVEEARPNAPAVLMLGAKKANVTVGGLNLLIDLSASPILLVGATDKNGVLSIPLAVPNLPALDGATLHAQFAIVDSNGSLGFASSRGLTFELFAR